MTSPVARIRGIRTIKGTSNRIMTDPVIIITIKRITLRRRSFI
jgi:hypothetical protein